MNEIQIQNTPAIFKVNFEDLRDSLTAELKKYDLVVTAETVKETKQLAADLNKTAKMIDDRLKEEIAKASEPIRRVDDQRKELVALCKEGRLKLTGQVAKFEDEIRALALDMVTRYRDELWNDLVVSAEYRRAKVDDLALLSSITAKNNLTSAARANVRSRVEADKHLQDQTERRILSLENASFKAGLSAPLSRVHVESFIFADDETYRTKLDALIRAEIDRQETAVAREAERLAREDEQRQRREKARADQAAAEEAVRIKREEALAAAAEQQQSEPSQASYTAKPVETIQPTASIPEWVRVTAVFEIQVPNTASNKGIEAALLNKLAEAGFESTPKITIERLG